jgi:hypothetical protein
MSEIRGILEGEERDAELRRPLPVETPYDDMCSKPHMLLYYSALTCRSAANIWLIAASFEGGYAVRCFPLFVSVFFDSCTAGHLTCVELCLRQYPNRPLIHASMCTSLLPRLLISSLIPSLLRVVRAMYILGLSLNVVDGVFGGVAF